MATSWAEDLVRGWDDQIDWTAAELKRVSAAVERLAAANLGVVQTDEGVPGRVLDRYRQARASEALDAHVARLADGLFTFRPPWYPAPTDEFSATLPFVSPSRLAPRLELNSASVEELASLPGVGTVTAARIIAYRRQHHGIRSVWALRKIRGLDEAKVRQFAPLVYVRDGEAPPKIGLHDHARLRVSSGFGEYVRFMRQSGLRIHQRASGAATLQQLLVLEVERLAGWLENHPDLHRGRPGIRAAEVARLAARDELLEKHEATLGDRDVHGVLLRDGSYRPFVIELLSTAQTRIWLMMFFFRFEDRGSYPTDPLMAELIAAKRRGVDVRVILDHQDEDDPRPSEQVNKAAYEYLVREGVPVTFDSEERLTHSKLLIVDDAHVVIGSHNWTAGSLLVYHDVSLYVESPKLATVYRTRFTALWELYTAAHAATQPPATVHAQPASDLLPASGDGAGRP